MYSSYLVLCCICWKRSSGLNFIPTTLRKRVWYETITCTKYSLWTETMEMKAVQKPAMNWWLCCHHLVAWFCTLSAFDTPVHMLILITPERQGRELHMVRKRVISRSIADPLAAEPKSPPIDSIDYTSRHDCLHIPWCPLYVCHHEVKLILSSVWMQTPAVTESLIALNLTGNSCAFPLFPLPLAGETTQWGWKVWWCQEGV